MPTFRKVFQPYVLIGLGDRWFLPANRSYKPLGCPGDAWYDYRDHSSRVRIPSLTPARAARIGLRAPGGEPPIEGGYFYLYNDATNPENSLANLRRYEAILAKLMKLDVQHVVKRQAHHYPGATDVVARF